MFFFKIMECLFGFMILVKDGTKLNWVKRLHTNSHNKWISNGSVVLQHNLMKQ